MPMPMPIPCPPARRRLALWLAGALPCLLLAAYTGHAWEDWYIMFRSAQNAAAGQGLVYQAGERLQTFSSPLNALLATALAWLSGGSVAAVLWLSRLVAAALLGGTALLLDRLGRGQQFGRPALLLLLGWFIADGKTADFAINGMETPFVVFFTALALVALLERRAALLGLAWAGLMWSRPDSVVYIAATALGWLLALWRAERGSLPVALPLLLRAGLLTTLLYAPWFAWSWWYYGSPVPQTVIAKGLGLSLSPGLLAALLLYPLGSILGSGHPVLDALFTPAYVAGWPAPLMVVSLVAGWIAAFAWLLPRATVLVRTASFGAFIGAFYLQYLTPYPYPWYFPPCTLLAIVTLAGLLQQRLAGASATARGRWQALAVAMLLLWSGVFVASACEWRVQQAVIEAQRRDIGLWLKAHAATPRDTVFVECMGYIGFYSGLKMEDFPGIASAEVVAARRRVGDDWAALIAALRPDWVVLRPVELSHIESEDAGFLRRYRVAAAFDRSEALAAVAFLPGRDYLDYDQTFVVLRRVPSG